MKSDETSDLLSGYESIGRHLGMTDRQAKHLSESGVLPTFKLPGSNIVRARRSTLDGYLAEQEAKARKPVPETGERGGGDGR